MWLLEWICTAARSYMYRYVMVGSLDISHFLNMWLPGSLGYVTATGKHIVWWMRPIY